jgi:replicative superfamily II helicase
MHGTAEISRLAGAPVTKMARELAIRVENGASRELLDLIELSGVGRVRVPARTTRMETALPLAAMYRSCT